MLLSAVAAVLLLASTAPLSDAHSYLVKPVARDNHTHSDPTNTVGCPHGKVGPVTSFQAGETIDVRYWCNNHKGGFIRWAMVPRGQESHDNFDQHAFYYTCRESGPECIPKKNPNSTFVSDGSPSYTIPCGDKITLPDWLPAGDYVLQWTWFGVGGSRGNFGWAEPQFRSCADIKLTTAGKKPAVPTCPTFVGGDRVTKAQNKPSDQCFYYYTTSIDSAPYRGSDDRATALKLYKFGVPKAVAKCTGNHMGSTSDGDSVKDDASSSDDGSDEGSYNSDGSAGETGNDSDHVDKPKTDIPPATTPTPAPKEPMKTPKPAASCGRETK